MEVVLFGPIAAWLLVLIWFNSMLIPVSICTLVIGFLVGLLLKQRERKLEVETKLVAFNSVYGQLHLRIEELECDLEEERQAYDDLLAKVGKDLPL